jgi:hypothetical protein
MTAGNAYDRLQMIMDLTADLAIKPFTWCFLKDRTWHIRRHPRILLRQVDSAGSSDR